MIKQKGHTKSLDIWNLGVLFFELLTGRPPFEGKNQQELFQNILNFKIRWPKGFSGVAKDLVSKLLKSDPEQRIELSQIVEHPWFQAHKPMRPITQNSVVSQKLDPSGEIDKGKYAIISKPSFKNKVETVAEVKAEKINFDHLNRTSTTTPTENAVDELNKKITDLTVQNNLLDKELRAAKQEIADLKENKGGDNPEILEELETLRRLKLDRETILQDLDSRSKSMRQTETQLKMKQNEIEILSNSQQIAKEKLEAYKRKIETLEQEITELTTRAERAEKEKQAIEIESK